MTNKGVGFICLAIMTVLFLVGCTAQTGTQDQPPNVAWPGNAAHDDPDRREVTVVIALSSVVPGGIAGHAGIAVDQQYWDFGPQRVERHQRLKAFDSPAGPWWDDPDQQWVVDRTLSEVLADMPDKVRPPGSLVAMIRVEVTDVQAEAITAFWDETYLRMRRQDDRYQLAGRQCANMVGWSLAEALSDNKTEDHLPRSMRMMTPTRLYETLRDGLRHTAGPRTGEPANVTLWQLNADGLVTWQRPEFWDKLGVPELPRTRLAFERAKHTPLTIKQQKR